MSKIRYAINLDYETTKLRKLDNIPTQSILVLNIH